MKRLCLYTAIIFAITCGFQFAQWANASRGADWTAIGNAFVEEAFNLSYVLLLIALVRYRQLDVTSDHPAKGLLRLAALLNCIVGALVLALSLFQLATIPFLLSQALSIASAHNLNAPGLATAMFEATLSLIQRVSPYVAALAVYRSMPATRRLQNHPA